MTKFLRRSLLLVALLLLSLMLTACQVETPYDKYDREGYTVSVKFDANGGAFTTNTTVIVDTANPDNLSVGADGMKELPLISPSDPARGSGNAFTPIKSGYFLAGWYSTRTEVTDGAGNALDIDGNIAAESGKEIAYTYSGKWDFASDRLDIDPNKTYTSKEPVLTLYAAWVPEFSFEFYTKDGKTLVGTTTVNPTLSSEIQLPKWNLDTGKLEYNGIPQLAGKTLVSIYEDKDGEAITAYRLTHTGVFNPADASYENNVMKLYCEYAEGSWYRISTAKQFQNLAAANGCYYIEADLNFEGKWTNAFNNMFSGKIYGNGHKFTGISQRQTTKGRNNGLFGQISKDAVIKDLTIENANYTVAQGSSTAGATFGLFAGAVTEGAVITNVAINSSTVTIEVSNSITFPADYSFGKVAGLGYEYTGIDFGGIDIVTTESAIGSIYTVEVTTSPDSNTVTVTREKKPS